MVDWDQVKEDFKRKDDHIDELQKLIQSSKQINNMEVLNSEIAQGTLNSRTMRKKGLTGGIVTFQSRNAVFVGTVLQFDFDGLKRSYKVAEVSTIDANNVQACAVEYGYWANNLSRKKDFDVRSIIGVKLEIVEDEKTLAHLEFAWRS